MNKPAGRRILIGVIIAVLAAVIGVVATCRVRAAKTDSIAAAGNTVPAADITPEFTGKRTTERRNRRTPADESHSVPSAETPVLEAAAERLVPEALITHSADAVQFAESDTPLADITLTNIALAEIAAVPEQPLPPELNVEPEPVVLGPPDVYHAPSGETIYFSAAPPPVNPGPVLKWTAADETRFGDSTILAFSHGRAANGAYRWVLGGTDGKLAFSNDNGAQWYFIIDHVFGSFSITSITYANGKWIAGGGRGKLMYSTNAIDWTAVQNTHFGTEQTIKAISFANGKWFAGGTNGIMSSSIDNGLTWTRINNGTFGSSSINTIAWHGGRWVAGGTDGKMAYSDDNGITWTAVNSTFGNNEITVVAYAKGRWTAGGYRARLAVSPDGAAWRSDDSPFFILALDYNSSRWLAGGQTGRLAWTRDGEHWTDDAEGAALFGQSWVQAIGFGRSRGRGRWFAGGQNGKIIYIDEP